MRKKVKKNIHYSTLIILGNSELSVLIPSQKQKKLFFVEGENNSFLAELNFFVYNKFISSVNTYYDWRQNVTLRPTCTIYA